MKNICKSLVLLVLSGSSAPLYSASTFYTDYTAWETAATASGGDVIFEDFNGETSTTAFTNPLSSTAGATGVTTTLDLTTTVTTTGQVRYFTGGDWSVNRGDGSDSGVRIEQTTGAKTVTVDLGQSVKAFSFFGLDLFDTARTGTPYEYSFVVEIDFGSGFTTVYDTGATEEIGADASGSVTFDLSNNTLLSTGGTSGSQIYGDDTTGSTDGTHFGFISDSTNIEQIRFTHDIAVKGTGGSGENIAFDHFSFVVPEPSSTSLFALMGLVMLGRRKR